ncbi:MAG: hypothetical protein KatS3mg077_1347 [Candidatus Binatia bacterium]|nr:MAG: hypothetical protein KatS3mg077_1347 [Candidatus Binatia bacterium]
MTRKNALLQAALLSTARRFGFNARMRSGRCWQSVWVGLGLVVCTSGGCAGRYVRIEEKGMTCGEAQQLAIATVQRLGYRVAEVTRAEPGTPGVVVAQKQEGTRTARVLVQVFCTARGAEIEAKAEGQGLENLDFASQFQKTFSAVAAPRPTPRPLAETGVDVAVAIERATSSGLGVDLTAAELVPVHVRIANRTDRKYKLDLARIWLQTPDGRRLQPVPPETVAAKLPPEARAHVEQRALRAGTIAPQQVVEGYTFFPFGTYIRARVTLEDIDNQESEGFTIEF